MKRRIAYEPGASWVHRLHPLVKVAWLSALTILLFATTKAGIVLGVLGLAAALMAAGGVSLVGRRGARLILLTSLTLGALQLAFHREGAVVARVGPLAITGAGVNAALYVAGRFASVVILSYVFVFTTDPSDLAYALMRAGVPYRYGFALVTALRLVPVFEAEAETVYEAQLARGIGHDARSPRRALGWLRQLVMPVLSSALGKVDALAVSMEGRGFGQYPHRTFLRAPHFGRLDALALVVLGAVVAGAVIFP
jgi:energy-coupling factor transport system permease protein